MKILKADDGHQSVVDDAIVDDVVRSDDVPDAVSVSEVGVRVVGAHELHPALVHVQAGTVAAWSINKLMFLVQDLKVKISNRFFSLIDSYIKSLFFF